MAKNRSAEMPFDDSDGPTGKAPALVEAENQVPAPRLTQPVPRLRTTTFAEMPAAGAGRPSGAPIPEPRRSVRETLPPPSAKPSFRPEPPKTLEETGLSRTMVEELVLKALFFAGELRGSEIATRICLPPAIVEDVIEQLRKQHYIDLKGGVGLGVGKANMVFTTTPMASEMLRQILDRNRYNGPAPVPIEEWIRAVQMQTVRKTRVTRETLEKHFSGLVVRDAIFDGLGPAMNSGRAIFFYGPPGNGKTSLCQRLVRCYQGDIYVPHALLVDDFIIRVFDARLHHEVGLALDEMSVDARWVRCKRPLIVVGGELTMATLDLLWSPEVRYYEAPFQLKATNGMLLIDDFGRQRVSPKELLNRWIVPLENDVDYLTLHTGKKVQVPFDVFTAFSTNLNPADLVDDAFLRRVRYKVEVPSPNEEEYLEIWKNVCEALRVPFEAKTVQYLIDVYYRKAGRKFAGCHPRDLLEQVIDMASYRSEPARLSGELIDLAARNYFVHFEK